MPESLDLWCCMVHILAWSLKSSESAQGGTSYQQGALIWGSGLQCDVTTCAYVVERGHGK